MKIFRKNGEQISLSNHNFLAKGGEGTLYKKGKTVYKLVDPANMIPSGKILELQKLTLPNIIKPEEELFDQSKLKVGYTMKYVPDTYTLCKIFTKAFKNKNNISPDILSNLVKKFRELVSHCHSKTILMVDINELNFLVDNYSKEIYAIDVNSYQTPTYPATAIMESVRDRHTNGFNTESDWFSWGIISFQMFAGIHPYAGRHTKYKGLDDRMQRNISVFNSDVSIPKPATMNFLPIGLEKWYKELFDKGLRSEPPTDFDGSNLIILPKIKQVQSTGFNITETLTVDENIIECIKSTNHTLCLTQNYVYYDDKKYKRHNMSTIFFDSFENSLSAGFDKNKLLVYNYTRNEQLEANIFFDSLFVSDGRLYGIQNSSIIEVSVDKLISFKTVGNVLNVPNTTKTYHGIVIQNMLGTWYGTIVQNGLTYQIPLGNERIIDAKYKNGFLVFVTNHKNKYSRYVNKIENGKVKSMNICSNVSYSGINMNVADNGLLILINEHDSIEMTFDCRNIKVVDDNDLPNYFLADSYDVSGFRSNKVYKISTKGSIK